MNHRRHDSGIVFPRNTPGSHSSMRFGRVFVTNAPESPYYVLRRAHYCQNRARRRGRGAETRAFSPESRADEGTGSRNARTFAGNVLEKQVATLQCAHFCLNRARGTWRQAVMQPLAEAGQRPGARRAFSRAPRRARAVAAGSRIFRRRCPLLPLPPPPPPPFPPATERPELFRTIFVPL